LSGDVSPLRPRHPRRQDRHRDPRRPPHPRHRSTDDTFPAPRADIDAHARKAFGIFVSTAEEEVEILFEPDIAWRIEDAQNRDLRTAQPRKAASSSRT
jgi:hypothetical protein